MNTLCRKICKSQRLVFRITTPKSAAESVPKSLEAKKEPELPSKPEERQNILKDMGNTVDFKQLDKALGPDTVTKITEKTNEVRKQIKTMLDALDNALEHNDIINDALEKSAVAFFRKHIKKGLDGLSIPGENKKAKDALQSLSKSMSAAFEFDEGDQIVIKDIKDIRGRKEERKKPGSAVRAKANAKRDVYKPGQSTVKTSYGVEHGSGASARVGVEFTPDGDLKKVKPAAKLPLLPVRAGVEVVMPKEGEEGPPEYKYVVSIPGQVPVYLLVSPEAEQAIAGATFTLPNGMTVTPEVQYNRPTEEQEGNASVRTTVAIPLPESFWAGAQTKGDTQGSGYVGFTFEYRPSGS